MTLPHDMARLFLAEQIYRGFTVVHGHPYSR
jgi:23S rRNA (pseudouridine1915-N3)-methyltransferase